MNRGDGVEMGNESVLHGDIREHAHGRIWDNAHYESRRASRVSNYWRRVRGDVDLGTWGTEMDLHGETKKEEKNWEKVFPVRTDCYLGWDGMHTHDVVGEVWNPRRAIAQETYPSGESERRKKCEAERHQAMTVEKRPTLSRGALSAVTGYPTSH